MGDSLLMNTTNHIGLVRYTSIKVIPPPHVPFWERHYVLLGIVNALIMGGVFMLAFLLLWT